jgi:hypothetical protein
MTTQILNITFRNVGKVVIFSFRGRLAMNYAAS